MKGTHYLSDWQGCKVVNLIEKDRYDFVNLIKNSGSFYITFNIIENEHEVDFGHLRKTTAASWLLISGGNLKTSEYSGVMVSEIIIGSNKLFNLVGFNIIFLKLNVVSYKLAFVLKYLPKH